MIQPQSTLRLSLLITLCLACAGDFFVTLILAPAYPDYSHLRMVMSELGTSSSPYGIWMNRWWLFQGILFILSAGLLFKSCRTHGKRSLLIVLCMALFGLGAGLGSGLFPLDPPGSSVSLSGQLHDTLAAIGFVALAGIPFAGALRFRNENHTTRQVISWSAFIGGLGLLVMFIVTEAQPEAMTGLWQRSFLFLEYAYLIWYGTLISAPEPSCVS